MSKRPTKKNWHAKHTQDPYVKKAQQQGYRSRAVFKLEEIDQRHTLLRSGMTIVELGAAPGGWCQYVRRTIGTTGRLLAIDLLAIDAITDVDIIQGDVTEMETFDKITSWTAGQKIDAILSDMAPDLTGIRATDQARSAYLIEIALDTAIQLLKPNGFLLIKGFHGQEFQNILQQIKQQFKTTSIEKPKASRDYSSEVYVLARQLRKI
jgi:23S rRNA (uridine2552-2'-O)-methyltransferase